MLWAGSSSNAKLAQAASPDGATSKNDEIDELADRVKLNAANTTSLKESIIACAWAFEKLHESIQLIAEEFVAISQLSENTCERALDVCEKRLDSKAGMQRALKKLTGDECAISLHNQLQDYEQLEVILLKRQECVMEVGHYCAKLEGLKKTTVDSALAQKQQRNQDKLNDAQRALSECSETALLYFRRSDQSRRERLAAIIAVFKDSLLAASCISEAQLRFVAS